MTMDNEILGKCSDLFAGIWIWSMIIAVVSFIIFNILFLFLKLLKTENVFLGVCALVFIHISLAAAVLMIISAILRMLQ